MKKKKCVTEYIKLVNSNKTFMFVVNNLNFKIESIPINVPSLKCTFIFLLQKTKPPLLLENNFSNNIEWNNRGLSYKCTRLSCNMFTQTHTQGQSEC